MKAYPVYKELSLDFLDSVPMHWDITKLKYLSSVNFSNVDKHTLEDEIPVLLCNYVDVYKNDFIKPDMNFMKATATEVEISKFTLRRGDVLITKDSESWDDIAIPAYVVENMEGVLCGYHLAQIRPTSIDGKFLFWVLCSTTLNDQYKVEAHGITRYGLGKDSIENSFIPIPSLPEQQAIADFLDCKASQIDALIEKKQQQINLLDEQRTALINHAVTKGLNPDAPMKDSGVEWLGEIPSHWKVKRIKHLVQRKKYSIKTGPFGSQLTNADMMGTEVKVYNQRSVIDNDFVNGENYVSSEKFQQLKEFEVFAGDILITTRGTIGRCAIFPDNAQKGILHPCLIRLQLNEEVMLKEYLIWFIQDSVLFQQSIFFESNATTIDVIYSGTMKQVFVPVPPVEEQQKIIKYLSDLKNKVQLAAEKLENEIMLLQEYRAALISEAVTGKIDVRTAV